MHSSVTKNIPVIRAFTAAIALAMLSLAGCGGGSDAAGVAPAMSGTSGVGPVATARTSAAAAAVQAAPQDATADQNADAAYNAWINRFLFHDASNGKVYFTQTAGNHNQAEGWIGSTDTMIASDVYERTHGRAQEQFVDTLVGNFLDVNGTGWWANYDWNDDIGWIAMAQMRAYQTTGDQRFLDGSANAWNVTYNKGWNTASGGGGIWERMGTTSKCGLSNSPFVTVGAALHQITGDGAYLTKAEAIYGWVRANLFNASTGQVYGCMSYPNFGATGTVQGGTSSNNVYDSGSFLEAATSLYRVTGDTKYRDDAQLAIQHVIAQNPVLHHNSSTGNQWSYYFLRGLNQFCTLTKTCSQYSAWMRNNADAAWNNRDASNTTWDDWTSKTVYNDPDALMMSSAVAVWQLLPRTSDATAFPGTYQIQNVASKLALSVAGDSMANSAPIVQQAAASTATALWTLVPTDNGYFQIKNAKTGQLLNVAGASGAPSAKVVQWPAQASSFANDQWLPIKQTDGNYVFFNLNSHLALDNPGGSTQTGTQLSQWQASGTTAQEFALIAQAPSLPNGALACFYADANFKGDSYCATANSNWVGTTWNDRISSVRIAPGYNVQLYQDINYGGSAVALESDLVDLTALGFNDQASSFKIFQNGVSSSAAKAK